MDITVNYSLVCLATNYQIIMSDKPFPYTEPWASFDRQSYSMITEQFPHEKIFAVTLRPDAIHGNSVYAKTETSLIKDGYRTSGELNILMPIWSLRRGYVFLTTRPDQLRIRYGETIQNINPTFSQCRLYGSYQSSKCFNNVAFKAGATLFAKSFSIENRVKFRLGQTDHKAVETGHKFAWANQHFSFNAYQIFNWKHRSLINNAIRFGFRKDSHEFFLRAQNQTSRSLAHLQLLNMDTYFKKFTVDYVKQIDQLTKIGIETQLTKNSIQKSSLVIQRSTANWHTGVKARICTDKSLAICYQSILEDYGKWTAGFEVSDIGRTNKFRYGLRFDFHL